MELYLIRLLGRTVMMAFRLHPKTCTERSRQRQIALCLHKPDSPFAQLVQVGNCSINSGNILKLCPKYFVAGTLACVVRARPQALPRNCLGRNKCSLDVLQPSALFQRITVVAPPTFLQRPDNHYAFLQVVPLCSSASGSWNCRRSFGLDLRRGHSLRRVQEGRRWIEGKVRYPHSPPAFRSKLLTDLLVDSTRRSPSQSRLPLAAQIPSRSPSRPRTMARESARTKPSSCSRTSTRASRRPSL